MTTFNFSSNGCKLAATLRAPSQTRRPAVVVVGSWTTVKEQMPARYADKLAAAGFAALTFDFRGFGDSEGGPREVESGRSKAEDLVNAVACLRTRPEVDPERIGILAVCASSSYTALAFQGATAQTSAVKSVAMVAPWIHDAALVDKLYGGAAAVAERLTTAKAARDRYAATGEIEYIPAASNRDHSAAMYMPGDALDYYLNPKRGAIPQWGARFATMAWTEWLQSNFVALGSQFALPLAIVTGKDTATPTGAADFIALLPARPTVTQHAGSQFDFYDNDEVVEFAAARAVDHFHNTIGA